MLDKTLQEEIIARGRGFLRGVSPTDPVGAAFESDQELHLPQPPLVKAAMTPPQTHIPLPDPETAPLRESNLTALLRGRRSVRSYGDVPLTLSQLSYLLWAGQGVTGIRGTNYATLRTVPSGGARHAFETYLLCRSVEGLEPGAYHYLPMEHSLEYLGPWSRWRRQSPPRCWDSGGRPARARCFSGPCCPTAPNGATGSARTARF